MGSDKDSSSRKGAERKNMKTYTTAYADLFSFLMIDTKSPLKYVFVGGTTICYDMSGDMILHQLVRDYVEASENEGINPWQNLRFGAKVQGNEWVDFPRVEFLPGETSPIFTFYVRYNWGKC